MKSATKKAKLKKQISSLEKLRDTPDVPKSTLDDVEQQLARLNSELSACDEGCAHDEPATEKPETGKRAGKKKTSVKLSDVQVEDDLERCKEVIKQNRPEPKPRVHHNRETRLKTALKSVVNICLEGNEEDADAIERLEKKVLKFEIDLKREFLGLKLVKPSPELKEKFEKAAEHAASA